ncbi:beta family protein [Vibrio cholerae]|uniref:beta family protein n=1 Tax=Vibrio cholerae TaxID=666 RepID=UPI003D7D6DA9
MNYKPYLPILKWRQGEYQALLRLNSHIKQALYPLFVVPPIEYDFESKRPKKTAQDYIEPLVDRIEKKWGKGLASIQLHESLHDELMNDGTKVPIHIFNQLLTSQTTIQPVIMLDYTKTYIDTVIEYSKQKNCGLIIRITFETLADSDQMSRLDNWIEQYDLNRANIDIVVDYDTKAEYVPNEKLAFVTSILISNIDSFDSYRAIYLAGTTLDFSSVPTKSSVTQPREYWTFFKYFYKEKVATIPNLGFGDYAIEPPGFAPSLDMRKIKPAARIIYSTEDCWAISKGSAFRDNPAQMHDMCHDFVYKSGHFIDKKLSNGDMKIYECAHKQCSNGSLTTWKEAGISHHLSLIVHQLANFHET